MMEGVVEIENVVMFLRGFDVSLSHQKSSTCSSYVYEEVGCRFQICDLSVSDTCSHLGLELQITSLQTELQIMAESLAFHYYR